MVHRKPAYEGLRIVALIHIDPHKKVHLPKLILPFLYTSLYSLIVALLPCNALRKESLDGVGFPGHGR